MNCTPWQRTTRPEEHTRKVQPMFPSSLCTSLLCRSLAARLFPAGKMLKDVKTTIESIGKPPEKLVIFGRSVGSLFAARAVELFPDIAGLVLESAIADPLERLLLRVHPEELRVTAEQLNTAVTEEMNIKRALQGYSGPTLIMHTRNDGLIDVSHAERLAEWGAGETKLEIFHHGSHNDIMFVNGPRYFGLLNEFLDSLRD